MSTTPTDSSLESQVFELAPFKGFLGSLIWFLLPGLLAGALFYQITSHADQSATENWFTVWSAESPHHLFTVVQTMLVFFAVHFLTTSVRHRWSSLIFALVFTALCVTLQWYSSERFLNSSNPGVEAQGWPLALAVALTIVIGAIAIPFYRTIYQRKQSFSHYPSLFEFAWNQSVVLLLSALFIGLVMTLISVADTLFKTINLDVVKFVWESHILMPIIGAAFGVGVGISRQYENVIHALVSLIIGLFRAILPIQLLVVLVFIGFTFFSSHYNFDNTRDLKLIFLVATGIGLTLCTAGVGHTDAPISRWLGASWRLMSFASLCLSIVAVLLVVERIKSYGYTHVHSLAGILTIIGLLYSIGYSISALFKTRGRDGIKWVNVFGALAVLVVAISIQTPPFDLVRHAATTQLTRIKEEGAPVPQWKLVWLEQDAGAAGQRVLDELYTEVALDLPSRFHLRTISRYASRSNAETQPDRWQESIDAKTLKVQFGDLSTNTDWTETLRLKLSQHYKFKRVCLEQKSTCRVFITDEIVPNTHMAVVVTRSAPQSVSIDWYRLTDEGNWAREYENSYQRLASQFRTVEEDVLDQLIEDIDNGRSILAPIEINAIVLNGKVFYPGSSAISNE